MCLITLLKLQLYLEIAIYYCLINWSRLKLNTSIYASENINLSLSYLLINMPHNLYISIAFSSAKNEINGV